MRRYKTARSLIIKPQPHGPVARGDGLRFQIVLRDGLAGFLIDLQRADNALFVRRMEPRSGLRVNAAQTRQHGLSAVFAQLRLERFAPAGLRDGRK